MGQRQFVGRDHAITVYVHLLESLGVRLIELRARDLAVTIEIEFLQEMPRQFVMVVHMVPWRRPSSSPRCRLACRSLRNPSCHRGRNINDGIAESFHTADQCRCKCFVCNEHAVNAIRHLRVLELNNLAHGNLRKKPKPPTSKPRGADVAGGFDNVASP